MQSELPGARFPVRRGFGGDEPPARFTVDGEAAWLAPFELLRRHRPPWETAMTPAALADLRVPLVVVTGGWSPLYEAIAVALADLTGGRHVQIEGAGHRPQDVPRFNDVLLDRVGRLPSEGSRQR